MWRLLEALVGSGTKLRVREMWEGDARRLCPQFPRDEEQWRLFLSGSLPLVPACLVLAARQPGTISWCSNIWVHEHGVQTFGVPKPLLACSCYSFLWLRF